MIRRRLQDRLAASGPAALALLAGGASALAVGLFWGSGGRDEVRRLNQETLVMAQRLQAVTRSDTASLVSVPQTSGPWPAQADSPAVWAGLQQRLQGWDLKVQSLRAQSQDSTGDLPEQTVQLRVQGRWSDWRAFEQAMAEHAPWWLPQHTLVVATGHSPDEVQVQLQARVGWQPKGDAPALPWTWQSSWPERQIAGSAPAIFGPIPEAGKRAAPPGRSAAPWPGSQTPADLSLAQWRLLGVWQQDGQRHAVLGHGAARLTVQEGQRVGNEGYRVRHVGARAVELAPVAAGQPALHMRLEEKP